MPLWRLFDEEKDCVRQVLQVLFQQELDSTGLRKDVKLRSKCFKQPVKHSHAYITSLTFFKPARRNSSFLSTCCIEAADLLDSLCEGHLSTPSYSCKLTNSLQKVFTLKFLH